MVRTTKITVETESLTIIHRPKVTVAWCSGCQAEVDVITLESDGSPGGVSSTQLQTWLSTDKLHVWQPASGPAQICMPSLLQCFEPGEVRRLNCPDQNPPAKLGQGR
jgi:hypothetical protein